MRCSITEHGGLIGLARDPLCWAAEFENASSIGRLERTAKMPTIQEMTTSLEDARFFHHKIEAIATGPEQHHDLDVIRRYFRGYLHCWKTVLHFVREAKGFGARDRDRDW